MGLIFSQCAETAGFPCVRYVPECASTSDLAKAGTEAERQHGTLVVAGHQTQGRGRHGRTWHTHEGTLAFSMALTQNIAPQKATAYTFLAGAAVLEACDTMPQVVSKWPNDILVEHRAGDYKKVAGILVEATSHLSKLSTLVVGIGMNLQTPPNGFPETLPSAGAFPLETEADRMRFLDGLSTALLKWVVSPSAIERLPQALALLTQRSAMKGKQIDVDTGSERIKGLFDGFGEDGALLLRQKEGNRQQITVGDVFFDGYENA